MTLEAPLAGARSGRACGYERGGQCRWLRRACANLAPEELEARAARGLAPAWQTRSRCKLDAVAADPGIARRSPIPEVGNPELPRFSTLRIGAALPDDATMRSSLAGRRRLGAMILRQQGVEDGYTAFLQNGDLSDPIARQGGRYAEQPAKCSADLCRFRF